MMSAEQLLDHLVQLGLVPAEAAQLLEVSPRTLRRWIDEEQPVPGPAEQALRAWLRLHRRGLAWRPEEGAVADDDAQAIARHREHALDLDATLERVKARGGPAAPWDVDLARGRATLGPMQVTFYRLTHGGFAPQSYRRTDEPADLQRDGQLLEDAYACIARALAIEGSAPRTRFAFVGPSLEHGRLALWDSSLTPAVAAVVSCDALRAVLGLNTTGGATGGSTGRAPVDDAACRRLVIANIALLTELAEGLFAQQRYAVKEHGLRVITIGADDLQAITHRLSKRILDTPMIWGTR